jgi:peptide/nickel transport system substrate-binding protein
MALVYDYLTRMDRNPDTGAWEVKPSLAQSWEIPDPTTVVLKLQPNVKFHDGTDFNSEAVKWNLERMMTHPKSSGKNHTATIDSIEAPDPQTVRLKLKSPSPVLFVNLTADADNVAAMVSPTWAKQAGDQGIATGAVGTGPFRLTEYQPSNQITYKKFDGYWKQGADGKPLPYVDEVTVKPNQDWNAALVQLRSGDFDVMWGLAGKDIPTVESNPDLKYVPAPWAATTYQIVFNAKPGAKFAGENMKKVRQAFNYALDREAIAKALGAGIGEANYQHLVPGQIGYSDKVTKYDFNLDKAKQLMTEAGYADGIDVTADFISRPEDTQNIQLYQQMLAKIGVRATLQPSERIAWVQKTLSGDYEFGTFQSPVRPEPDFLLSNILAENAPANYMNWSDETIQGLLREARTTYDTAKRQQLYEQVQNRIADEAYVGFVWRRSGALAASKALKNVAPGWTTPLSNSTEMWLDR